MAEKKDKTKKATRKPRAKKEDAVIVADEMKIEQAIVSNEENEEITSETIIEKETEISEVKKDTQAKKAEIKKENKTPRRNVDNMFGYSWNGQEMEF